MMCTNTVTIEEFSERKERLARSSLLVFKFGARLMKKKLFPRLRCEAGDECCEQHCQ